MSAFDDEIDACTSLASGLKAKIEAATAITVAAASDAATKASQAESQVKLDELKAELVALDAAYTPAVVEPVEAETEIPTQ